MKSMIIGHRATRVGDSVQFIDTDGFSIAGTIIDMRGGESPAVKLSRWDGGPLKWWSLNPGQGARKWRILGR